MPCNHTELVMFTSQTSVKLVNIALTCLLKSIVWHVLMTFSSVLGDKPHECPTCQKKFALYCNLKTHLKTHEGNILLTRSLAHKQKCQSRIY